jgi:hypothetical protein
LLDDHMKALPASTKLLRPLIRVWRSHLILVKGRRSF